MTTFNGFEPANTTPVPDALFDRLLPELSGAELKVLLYIIRRTRGFKKETDAISLSQFTDGIKTRDGKQLDYGCGIKNRTVVSKALADLIDKGCIYSTKGKDPCGDAAVTIYAIRFNEGVVSKPYHPGIETVLPLVSKPYHGSNQSVPGVVSKPYPQETVLQDTDKQETVLQEREVADATAPAKTSSQENDLEKTEKRRATPSPKKEVVHTHGFSPDAHIDSVVDHHFPADHLQSSSPPRTDNMVTEPTATRKRAANKGILPKHITQQGLVDEIPSLPASKPVEPLADMAWGTRKCLQWFDYWRGGTLIAKYKIQQAASCAKGLAEQFDEATVVRIRGDMADDPYYIERGGPDICDVANNIHKYLNKKKPKKEPSNEHRVSSFGTPGYNFADEFYPSEAEKKAYYAVHPQGVKS